MQESMPYRVLGRTGERVSAIGLGGWHLGLPRVSEALAIRLVRDAIDRGINFLDNSWDYNGGASEIRMGKALRDGYRKRAFLMTKIDGRSRAEAARQLEESLRRLETDCIDLVQHHEVIRYEDPHRIFDPEGANAALVAARAQGKLRYIGFTGHKDPRVHLHTLELAREHGFAFDAVQMPLSVMDAHYRSFERLVLPELVAQGIGVLGMKSLANGLILKSGTVTAVECLRYALDLQDVGRHHGNRQPRDPGPGRGDRGLVPAARRGRAARAARQDRAGRRARRIRAVQDDLDLRRDDLQPEMAG
jgi:aryl-alcohol dehydrogenase-like predicted oxidoreductase